MVRTTRPSLRRAGQFARPIIHLDATGIAARCARSASAFFRCTRSSVTLRSIFPSPVRSTAMALAGVSAAEGRATFPNAVGLRLRPQDLAFQMVELDLHLGDPLELNGAGSLKRGDQLGAFIQRG